MQTVGQGAQAPSSTAVPVVLCADHVLALTPSRFRTPRRSGVRVRVASAGLRRVRRGSELQAFERALAFVTERAGLASQTRVGWADAAPAAPLALLNGRVVSVLKVIGAEPELSDNEIAERVGIEGKGHASTLLSRLARFGLIENLVLDPAPFGANAWQLTSSGVELADAISADAKATPTRALRTLCTTTNER